MQHLTLEQCKKLKEIGYPRKTAIFIWSITLTTEWHISWVEPGDEKFYPRTYYDCPTLEELIEWLSKDRYFWKLYGADEDWGAEDLGGKAAKGSSPLEAVYNLCLAINQPNQKEV